jgi:hypothetical protein
MSGKVMRGRKEEEGGSSNRSVYLDISDDFSLLGSKAKAHL